MKNKIFSIFVLTFLFLSVADSVKAADEPCMSDADCKARCIDGKFTSALALGQEIRKCTIGIKSGVLKQGETCTKQEECASELYCKDTVGSDECEPKVADGGFCGNGSDSSACSYACVSNKYYSDVTDDAIWYVCGTKPTTGGTTPTTGGSGDSSTVPGTTNATNVVIIENPLGFSSVEEFVTVVLTRIRQIIVVLSLVFILIGAIMYVVSAGNADLTGQAKKAITASLIGLAIGIAAPSFLKEIGGVLGWDAGQSSADVAGALTLSQIAMNVLNFLLGIFGALAMIMLIIGGITYLTSAGDENRIDSGKKIFTYSLIGIVVAMSSLVIVKQLAKFFM